MDFLQILSGIMTVGALLCVFAAQILWEPSDDHHIYYHNIAILLLVVLIIVIVVVKHLKVIDCFRNYLNAFTRHPLETTEEDEKWHNSLAIARLPRLTYSTIAPPPPAAAPGCGRKPVVLRGKCEMCLQFYQDADELTLLPACKHVMHRECAERSLVRMDVLECPMCGAEVGGRGGGGWDGYNYHQLKHDDIRLYLEEQNDDDDEAEQEKKKEVEGAKPKKK